MPLHSYQPETIIVRVADIEQGDTRYCQLARFTTLAHSQAASAEAAVVITVTVALHEMLADGTPGEPLNRRGITTYDVALQTDNDTLVDMATGGIIAARQPGETSDAWRARADSYEQDVMFQTTYFCFLRDNFPIQIGEMVRQHIRAANLLLKRFS
jgi:hypothetical protein